MLRVHIENDQQDNRVEVNAGWIALLGRQVTADQGTHAIQLLDDYVSRQQLRLSLENDGSVLLENLSKKVPVFLESGQSIAPLGRKSVKAPICISVGETTLNLEVEESDGYSGTWLLDDQQQTEQFRSISRKRQGSMVWNTLRESHDEPRVDSLIEWFEALISVQRSAAGSEGFYLEIADAAVQLVGLDYGLVLLLENSRWKPAAVSGIADDEVEWSNTIIERVLAERETFYEPLDEDHSGARSLMSLSAVVASPIISATDDVVGIVYGARLFKSPSSGTDSPEQIGISEIEAHLVQLLAASAATGLARAEKEAEAAKLRVQFEEFCSAEIVTELQQNPQLLDAAEREITVLFCDVRGFTELSDRFPPKTTYEVMSDVLDGVVECVLSSNGVIIDFYGDGAAAMWNAPCEQPNHHELALECADKIQLLVHGLNAKWKENNIDLKVGIGINTGPALVGNVGGTRRIKYGPRGSTVNLASRIEGLTKHLGVDVLLAESTHRRFNASAILTRRVGQFQVKGIEEPVVLHERISGASEQHTPESRELFARALKEFEEGNLQAAELLFNDLTQKVPGAPTDRTAVFLKTEIRRRQSAPNDTPHYPFIRLDQK